MVITGFGELGELLVCFHQDRRFRTALRHCLLTDWLNSRLLLRPQHAHLAAAPRPPLMKELAVWSCNAGTTASLLSKYRPPMPIMTLVIPRLKSDTLSWKLEGRSAARQCLIERGLLPVLAAPSPSGTPLRACLRCGMSQALLYNASQHCRALFLRGSGSQVCLILKHVLC